MSLDPKRGIKTKHIELSGTQKDFDALADVMRQAVDKLNIDIVPGDLDIPGRIMVRTKGKKNRPTQWVYPKLAKALNEFAEGLTENGDAVVDFGKANITEKPEDLIRYSPTLRKMNQNSIGKDLQAGDIFKEDIIQDMQTMLDPRTQLGRQAPLTEMVPAWVYASDLILHRGKTPLGIFVRDTKMLERIDEYPPDLGGSMKWTGLGKEGYNQAYFVILRVDKLFPLEMPLRTKSGEWDRWIKSRPVPDMMKLYRGRPPKNFGAMLERFAVYTTARTFGMTDAFLAPVFAGSAVTQRFDSSANYADKILVSDAIKSKTGVKHTSDYATYLAFVVIGKGTTRTVDLGREPIQQAVDLPGWD
jgi:hypothetical protein